MEPVNFLGIIVLPSIRQLCEAMPSQLRRNSTPPLGLSNCYESTLCVQRIRVRILHWC
jgi:hypothetical protein